jgi:hypothetical protein
MTLLTVPVGRRPGYAAIPRHRPGHSARPGRLTVDPEGVMIQVYRPAGHLQYETATPDPRT